jgi:hypothetical protein
MANETYSLDYGRAGYVGGMLVRKFAERDDVERIIGLDKEPLPEFIAGYREAHVSGDEYRGALAAKR